jgi:hypothetical protein
MRQELESVERLDAQVDALSAEAVRKADLATRMAQGLSGLSGEENAAIIPYLDAGGEGREPSWQATGQHDFPGQLARGEKALRLFESPKWILASVNNDGTRAREAWRPAKSQFMACQRSGSGRSDERQLDLRAEVEQAMIGAGLIRRVGVRENEPGAHMGWNPLPPPDETKPAFCESAWEAMWIDRNRGGLQRFTIGPTWLEPTGAGMADYTTMRWLNDGCPGVFWACYHRNESTWERLTREAGQVVGKVLNSPAFAAVMIVVTYGAYTAAAAAGGPAGAIAQAGSTGSRATALIPGASGGAIAPGVPNALVQWGVNAQVIHRLVDDPGALSRDLARMIASGVLVPGYGPVAALILPDATNAFLQQATAEVFFTVPGYSSLVAHAEENKAKRRQLRAEFSRLQARFLERNAQIVQIVQLVLQVAGAILSFTPLAPLGIALNGLSISISVAQAALQLEATAVGMRAAYDEMKRIGAEQIRMLTEVIDGFRRQIEDLDRQIDDLRRRREEAGLPPIARAASGSGSSVLLIGALALAAVAFRGRR